MNYSVTGTDDSVGWWVGGASGSRREGGIGAGVFVVIGY